MYFPGGCQVGGGGFSQPGGGSAPGGCLLPGGFSLPRGRWVSAPGGGFSLPGGSAPGGWVSAPGGGGSPCPETPPVNRITHTCKNITLATISLLPVKINQTKTPAWNILSLTTRDLIHKKLFWRCLFQLNFYGTFILHWSSTGTGPRQGLSTVPVPFPCSVNVPL